MSAVQHKEAVEQAVTSYKRKKAALDNCVTKKQNARSLKVKIQLLEDSLKDLNVAHTSWVSKGKFDAATLAAETYSSEWLSKTWDEVDELVDRANVLIEGEELLTAEQPLTKTQKLSLLRKQMETLQRDVTNELDSLSTNTAVEKLNTSTHAVYAGMLSKVQVQLQTTYGELSKSILTLSGADFDEDVKKHEDFRQLEQKRFLDVQVKLAKLAPDSSQAKSPPIRAAVQMEKCTAPTFSGRTIEYPEFKQSWCKIAGTVWDDANQIEQMKQKVDVYTKKIVSRCSNMKTEGQNSSHQPPHAS